MSYSCTISFKTINADEIYSFFQQAKKACIDNIESFAQENYAFSPPFKRCSWKPIEIDYTEEFCELEESIETWAKNSIFKFRWFYLKDLNLLGVYTDDKSLKPLFDCTIYFQNSCDQDYEFEEWNGVAAFEQIADKYKNMSDADLAKKYKEKMSDEWDADEHTVDLQYYAKSFAYDEVWNLVEHTLYNDDEALYLSVFGYYDILHMKRFSKAIIDAINQCVKEAEERIANRKAVRSDG